MYHLNPRKLKKEDTYKCKQSGQQEGDIYGLCRQTHSLRAPRIGTWPQGTQGRVTVHDSATTMCLLSCTSPHTHECPVRVFGTTKKAREGPLVPLSPRRASNLRPPGRSPRALLVCYATDVVGNPKQRPPAYNGKSHRRCFVAALFRYTKNNSCSWGGRRRRLHGSRRAAMTERTVGPGPRALSGMLVSTMHVRLKNVA